MKTIPLLALVLFPGVLWGQALNENPRAFSTAGAIDRAGHLPHGDQARNGGIQALANLPAAIDRDRVDWDAADPESLWVRGKDFKANFKDSGFAFVPFLGSDAPRNFPVTMSLGQLRMGGDRVALERNAMVKRQDDRMSWNLGTVEERVQVSSGHLEHSFLLAERDWQGELLLAIDVQTELSCGRDGAGLLFSNELGGVRYSCAVAFDEAGNRIQLDCEWSDEQIHIRVPASFVDQAQGAILVDPFLSTFVIDDAGIDLRQPDLAYDYESDRYLVVYREQFSGQDHDIYSRVLDGGTGAAVSSGYIFSGDEDSAKPSVAYHKQTRAFMVVAQQRDFSLGISQIVGRTKHAVTGVLSPLFALDNSNTAYEVFDPVVGGDHWSSGNSFMCIAWERQEAGSTSLFYALVDGTGALVQATSSLHFLSNSADSKLCISKSTGNSGPTSYWQLAWQGRDWVTGDASMYTQRIRYDGVLTGPRMTLQTNVASPGGPPAPSFFHMSVSDLLQLGATSSHTDALVVFGSGNSHSTTLSAAIVNQNTFVGPEPLHDSLNHNQEFHVESAIATTNEHWILTWIDATRTIYGAVAQPVNGHLAFSEGRFEVANNSTHLSGLMACATASGGGPDVWSDAMLVWADGISQPNIHGARVYATQETVAGLQYCVGQPNSSGQGAHMTAVGGRLHSTPKELRTDNLPISVFGYYLVGTSQVFIPMPAGSQGNLCVGGNLGRYNRTNLEILNSGSAGTFFLEIDPSSIPLATGNATASAGQTFHFQAWYRDTVAGASSSNFSTAVSIPFL